MRDRLEPLLIWATPGQRGFPSRQAGASARQDSVAPISSASGAGPSTQRRGASHTQEAARKQQEALQKAAELRQMLSTLEKVDDEGRRSSLLDTLCSTDDILNLPLHPNPPSIKNGDLTVDLLKHQVMAVHIRLIEDPDVVFSEPSIAVVC
jgi:SWI/SNF-related matrix-associated actin-dependent regulator of chromatin subfamily A3